MPTRLQRVALLEDLQKVRGDTKVIAYVTNTRPGFQESMGLEAVPIFNRHLRKLRAEGKPKVDLFIHSDGGDGIVPWRLVTLLREYCSELTLLVPHRAFSAATLLALGCDKVIMGPMGHLGPTDATVSHPFNPPDPRHQGRNLGISVEDVSSFIALVREDVGIRHEDELVQAFNILARRVHPLALGNVKRSTSQSRLMGIKLLKQRLGAQLMTEHDVTELVDKLTSRLYYHGHTIGRTEARDDLKLNFVEEATPSVADAMWSLYEAYADDMLLDTEFNFFLAAMDGTSPAVPAPPKVSGAQLVPSQPTVVTKRLDPMIAAMIESSVRTDRKVNEFEVTLTRDWKGEIESSGLMIVGDRWEVDEATESTKAATNKRKSD